MIKPEIGLSDIYFDLTAESGSSFERSFKVYSKNGQELSGKVLSTNDKIVPMVTELSGTECEIPFYFKGKMAIPGEEHLGDFLLLTNGGEYNIPFSVTVIRKKYWFGDRAVSDLNDFYALAKEDWKKAKDIFFTKDFPDIVLAEEDQYCVLYHDLLKGFSKDMILEQFLMETMGKAPARIYGSAKEIRIDESKVGRLSVEKEGWGCLEVRLYGESGNLLLNRERLTQEDFEEGNVELFLSFKEGEIKDTLIMETAFDRIRVPVHKKMELSVSNVEGKKYDPDYASLLRYFVDFRTGKLTTEEYIGYSMKRLPHSGHFYELYCLLLLCIKETELGSEDDSCQEYGKKIESQKEIYLTDSKCRDFYYYVMALWKKEKSWIKEAADSVKASFERKRTIENCCLLFTLDEKIAFQYETQWEILLRLIEEGENSPLLYLAILDVLNQEPYLLEQLQEKIPVIIRWGLRHQYVSQKLLEQFCRISLRERTYHAGYLNILIHIYDRKQDELYLKAICSMLMKGNKREPQYHRYFEEAIRCRLNLIGINEFYLRSLDFSTYPVLPKLILYYFHYSSSLDRREKAWLYLNILLHKEEYDDIYDTYYERILEFIKEQLAEGRMNRHLKLLYEAILPEVLEESEYARFLPNIIFRKKLSCKNPMMEGVYICHPENEEEIYVPLLDGCCQVDIYSPNVRVYFADRMGNRYHTGIPYSIVSYLEEDNYKEYCLAHGMDNKKVYIKWIHQEQEDKKEELVRLLVQNEEVKSWKREKAVERILDYHYEEKTLEDLSECLDKINYRIISPSYRRTLMNYYMACNRMEDAYFGVELYGSDAIDSNQLYLLTCVGLYLHKEERDELLLTMAYRSFVNRKYNKEILVYLRSYFEGRVFDLIDLWTILKKEGLDTVEFEERVLEQGLFVGTGNVRVLEVLLSYLDKKENEKLADAVLKTYSNIFFRYGMGDNRRIGHWKKNYLALLDKMSLSSMPMSRTSRLSYLLYKSEDGWKEEERPIIRKMLLEFFREEIIFPFFDRFSTFLSIPSLWRESVCFWFFSDEKEKPCVSVNKTIGDKKIRTNLSMREIAEGLYYEICYLPSFEQIERAELEGKETSVCWKPVSQCIPGSRNQLLLKMEEEKNQAGAWMNDYEKIMRRMGEQLSFLWG